jgi:hypothetical protein
MIGSGTLGSLFKSIRCLRGGSGTASIRLGPSYPQKWSQRKNLAVGLELPRGRYGHFNGTGWPRRILRKGISRPGRMMVQASQLWFLAAWLWSL